MMLMNLAYLVQGDFLEKLFKIKFLQKRDFAANRKFGCIGKIFHPMKIRRFLFLSFSLVIFCSCTPTSHKGFVKRTDAVFQAMIRVLEQVDHPGDFYLLQALKPLYLEVAELAVLSNKKQEQDPKMFSIEILEAPHQAELQEQLMRIYSLEGGQKAIEDVAREGLILLQKSPKKSL